MATPPPNPALYAYMQYAMMGMDPNKLMEAQAQYFNALYNNDPKLMSAMMPPPPFFMQNPGNMPEPGIRPPEYPRGNMDLMNAWPSTDLLTGDTDRFTMPEE